MFGSRPWCSEPFRTVNHLPYPESEMFGFSLFGIKMLPLLGMAPGTVSSITAFCVGDSRFISRYKASEQVDLSPVCGPCVLGVQTQALGPAHSAIRHHQPRVRVYPVNTPAVEKWRE